MANIRIKTLNDSNPKGKPRVYFSCHPMDFDSYFETISTEIFKAHNVAIYYKDDMSEEIEEKYMESDLAQMNLFVIPVTRRLLTEPNITIDSELLFAKENGIPILPFLMENSLLDIYSQPSKFGDTQYLDFYAEDNTAISNELKLEKYLSKLFVNNELHEKIRNALCGYIFLSYRKKDRHYANQLMKIIHSYPEYRDIAIWYDEFLSPGDNFRDEINKNIEKSELFTMLVTPNLLEEPNYVMSEEYPTAITSEKMILPAQMEQTDSILLNAKYNGIPECVDPLDKTAFQKCLKKALEHIAHPENANDAEHLFLIGMAYRDGIEVEVDRKKARELFKLAADAGNPDAMFAMEYELFQIHNDSDATLDEDEENLQGQYYYKLVDYIDKVVINHSDKTINKEKLYEGLSEMISNYDEAICYMMQMKCMAVSSEIENLERSPIDILVTLESVYITQLRQRGMSFTSGAKMTFGMLSYLYSKRSNEIDSVFDEVFSSENFINDVNKLKFMRSYMVASSAYYLDEGEMSKSECIDGLKESLIFIGRRLSDMLGEGHPDVEDTLIILENI